MTSRRVLLVRPAGGDDHDAAILREAGFEVVEDPYLVVSPSSDPDAAGRAALVLDEIENSADWLFVTSRNAVLALGQLGGEQNVTRALRAGQHRGLRIGAVGQVTAEAISQCGGIDITIPNVSTAAGLADHVLRDSPPARAVIPRGNQAMRNLVDRLREASWIVIDPIVYETNLVDTEPTSARSIAGYDAIVLRSPSAVRALEQFVPDLPSSVVVVCGGPTTAAEARRLGLPTIVQALEPTAQSVCEAVVTSLANGDGS